MEMGVVCSISLYQYIKIKFKLLLFVCLSVCLSVCLWIMELGW